MPTNPNLQRLFAEVETNDDALIQARVVTAQANAASVAAQNTYADAVASEGAAHQKLSDSIAACKAALDAELDPPTVVP